MPDAWGRSGWFLQLPSLGRGPQRVEPRGGIAADAGEFADRQDDVAFEAVAEFTELEGRATEAPTWNPFPTIRTVVPPWPGPVPGVTEVTLGGGTVYSTPEDNVADCPSALVTVTSAGPTGPPGAAPSIRPGLTSVEPLTGANAMNATAPAVKFAPPICTPVPPSVEI